MGQLQSKWSLPITKTIEDKRNAKVKLVEIEKGMNVYTKLALLFLTAVMTIGITAFLVKETGTNFGTKIEGK